MSERLSLHRLALLFLILLGSAASATFSLAQGTATTERIVTPNGALYEILAQNAAPGTQFSWVLAKAGTFLQAGRSRSFRTRFTEVGEYRLTGENVFADGTRVQRVFILDVKDDVSSASAAEDIDTVPPANAEGIIAIPADSRIVTLVPKAGAVSGLIADVDVTADSNGDGIPSNDDDTLGTYFNTDSQSLSIWLTKDGPSTLRVAGIRNDGSAFEKTIGIGAPAVEIPAEETPTVPPTSGDAGTILVEDGGNGMLSFRLDESAVGSDVPVLLHWDFGDGSQSMLTIARHRYATDGTYTVKVNVRDLTQGTVIAQYERSIPVDVGELPPPTGGDGDGTPEPEPETPSEGSGSLFGLFLKILLVLIIAIVVGALIAVILKIVRRAGSLREKLEATDRKMAIGKSEGETPAGDAVAPLALPEMEEEEKTRREEETPPAPPPPQEPEGPVPTWLQSTEATGTQPPPPAPAASAPAAESAAVPDWLKAASEPASTPTPVAGPAATPVAEPKTETGSAPLPSWLAQTPAAPVTEPAPVTKPTEQLKQVPAEAPVASPPISEPAPTETPAEQPAPAPAPAEPVQAPPPPAEPIATPVSEELPAWLSGSSTQTADTTTPAEVKPEEAPPATEPAPETAPGEAPAQPAPLPATLEPTVQKEVSPPLSQEETEKPAVVLPQEPKPVPEPSPPAAPAPKEKKEQPVVQDIPAATAEDEPIAFVRAESIEEQKPNDDVGTKPKGSDA